MHESKILNFNTAVILGKVVVQLVETPGYKPEGRGFGLL
jgi:hypothetical protein